MLKELGTAKFEESPTLSFKTKTAIGAGFLKILGSGELNANGADRRLFVRINGLKSGYQGYVLMSGHAGAGEWDGSGFYLGRNGWALDANFSFEFTLAAYATSQKITGNGQSVFVHGNNSVLGYEAHSYFVTNQPIQSVDIEFTGGVAIGDAHFYLL
jgi:hypothetical protein